MAKKRANGEGNIRRRKDGRWEGRYTAGYDEKTGKRLIKNVLGKTQAEAKEKLAKAVAEAETVKAKKTKSDGKDEIHILSDTLYTFRRVGHGVGQANSLPKNPNK